MSDNTITPSEALTISTLINYTEQGIASRVLAKNTGGN
ncbi:cupin, partial [Vibrio parahaemolyticus]